MPIEKERDLDFLQRIKTQKIEKKQGMYSVRTSLEKFGVKTLLIKDT